MMSFCKNDWSSWIILLGFILIVAASIWGGVVNHKVDLDLAPPEVVEPPTSTLTDLTPPTAPVEPDAFAPQLLPSEQMSTIESVFGENTPPWDLEHTVTADDTDVEIFQKLQARHNALSVDSTAQKAVADLFEVTAPEGMTIENADQWQTQEFEKLAEARNHRCPLWKSTNVASELHRITDLHPANVNGIDINDVRDIATDEHQALVADHEANKSAYETIHKPNYDVAEQKFLDDQAKYTEEKVAYDEYTDAKASWDDTNKAKFEAARAAQKAGQTGAAIIGGIGGATVVGGAVCKVAANPRRGRRLPQSTQCELAPHNGATVLQVFFLIVFVFGALLLLAVILRMSYPGCHQSLRNNILHSTRLSTQSLSIIPSSPETLCDQGDHSTLW